MSSITFRDFSLNQTTITGRRKPEATVDTARIRFRMDTEARQYTDEIIGCAVDIMAAHGKVQTVKLPVETRPVVDEIIQAVRSGKTVKVSFGDPSTLRGRCYAMNSNGQLLSGVSATATEIKIVSIEDEETFDDLDEEIIL